ncbi:riboflavin biosynthesis protein RibF [Oceanithermus sp.]
MITASPEDVPSGPKVVAIGSFDGVHLGHRHLLARARGLAKERGWPLLVYTFDPPTKVFVRGVGMLSTLTEKLELLAQQGVDVTLAVPFNKDFASRSKEEFLEDLRRIGAAQLVVGADFGFGRGRSGGPDDLKKVAPTLTVPLLELDGEPVKSTRIRELLKAGDVEAARHLLGRPYSARGLVIRGDGIGAALGFPTANVEPAANKVLPPGVFVSRAVSEAGEYPAVVNVGVRPTLGGGELRFEAHLLGFNGDLYGHELRVIFLKKLRDERRFSGKEELRRQIVRDLEEARRFFGL